MIDRSNIEEQKNKLYGMSIEDFLDIFIFGRHFFVRKLNEEEDGVTIYEFWYDSNEEMSRKAILLEVKYLMNNDVIWSFDKDELNRKRK